MPAERHAGAAVRHALEEAQEALRAELRTQHPLSGENARLRARRSRLQAERDRLMRTLAGLKEASPRAAARLPGHLAVPFVVKARLDLHREVRAFLPALLFVLGWLATGWLQARGWRASLELLLIVLLARAGWLWLARQRWRFDATGLSGRGLVKGRAFAGYAEVVSVGVSVSPYQRRHGVGTVVVTVRHWSEQGQLQSLHLKDVPEPERLAAWLRAQCPHAA